jgi:hypothetical protein
MMYSSNFVATVKVGGKFLRENKDVVTVPFGSEYSIYLKNLSTVRALARVSVDGQDATEGVWLIVPAKGDLELERFIKNGNTNKGNRFKFIERTSQIEEHRGIGAEDGLIQVEYKFEAPQPQPYSPPYWYYPYWHYPSYGIVWTSGLNVQGGGLQGNIQGGQNTGNLSDCTVTSSSTSDYSGILRSTGMASKATKGHKVQEGMNQMNCCFASETSVNDAGITVAGSESNQQFATGAWFPTEEATHTLVLKLVGKVGGQKVVQAITVQQKPTCTTCGKINKATNKFCGRCGTSLVLI